MRGQARSDMPGAKHHSIVRAINRPPIFLEEEDQQNFLYRLGIDITEGYCSDYTWVLMDNHFPIHFKSGTHGISMVMCWLMMKYEGQRRRIFPR